MSAQRRRGARCVSRPPAHCIATPRAACCRRRGPGGGARAGPRAVARIARRSASLREISERAPAQKSAQSPNRPSPARTARERDRVPCSISSALHSEGKGHKFESSGRVNQINEVFKSPKSAKANSHPNDLVCALWERAVLVNDVDELDGLNELLDVLLYSDQRAGCWHREVADAFWAAAVAFTPDGPMLENRRFWSTFKHRVMLKNGPSGVIFVHDARHPSIFAGLHDQPSFGGTGRFYP
jgi:hypothetical protein